MKSAMVALAMAASVLTFGGAVFTTGAAAADPCQGVPPNRKFICCQKFPKSPACK